MESWRGSARRPWKEQRDGEGKGGAQIHDASPRLRAGLTAVVADKGSGGGAGVLGGEEYETRLGASPDAVDAKQSWRSRHHTIEIERQTGRSVVLQKYSGVPDTYFVTCYLPTCYFSCLKNIFDRGVRCQYLARYLIVSRPGC